MIFLDRRAAILYAGAVSFTFSGVCMLSVSGRYNAVCNYAFTGEIKSRSRYRDCWCYISFLRSAFTYRRYHG